MDKLTPSARENLRACTGLIVVTAVAVSLRFGIRLKMGQRPLGSDWLCLASLAFFFGYCAVIINYIYNVSKFHAFDADPMVVGLEELRNLLLNSFVMEILMTFVVTSVKLSILWFYYSIFSISPNTKKAIWATAALCLVWFIVAMFPLIIFQCKPIDAYWNMFNMAPACGPTQKLLLGYEITNLFIDVVILCLPLGAIGKLHLNPKKKVATAGMFLLGAFVCVTSIVRLTTIWDVKDPSRPVIFSPSIVWSTIQQGVAIVCSCLPTYGPLLRNIKTPFSQLKSRYYSGGSKGTSTGDSSSRGGKSGGGGTEYISMRDGSWAKVGRRGDQSSQAWANDSAFNRSDENMLEAGQVPAGKIHVGRNVEVV